MKKWIALLLCCMLLPLPLLAEESDWFTLSFIGDCSVGDSEQYIDTDTSYHTTIDKNGYAWPFSELVDYFENDDLTIANLEVVFTTRKKHTDKLYNLKAEPDHVNILLEGGVDVVNTVNNHCKDFLENGYKESMQVLDDAGILRFGTTAPGTEEGHDDLLAVDVGELRIGFVGFSYPQDYDQKKIASRIRILREEQGCNLVVVSLHWGRETFMTPEAEQIDYAKAIIDAGADIIWGHHPHVIQPIHIYKGKLIFYSTGNFTFGTMSDVDPSTGIFQVRYAVEDGVPVLKQLEVVPCQTRRSPDYRPYELTDEAERQAVWKKLTFTRSYKNMEDLPESFLTTGIVDFD